MFRPFQLAKLVDKVPEGDDWLFEMKFDGYRCQAELGGGKVTLYSRSGLDWTRIFQYLVPAFEKLEKGVSASIDGEVVAIDEKGRANFNLLQRSLKLRDPRCRPSHVGGTAGTNWQLARDFPRDFSSSSVPQERFFRLLFHRAEIALLRQSARFLMSPGVGA